MKKNSESGEFIIWTLPAQEYIVCGVEAETFKDLYSSALKKAWTYSIDWIKKYDLVKDIFDVEIFYGEDNIYMEYWFPVVSGQPSVNFGVL